MKFLFSQMSVLALAFVVGACSSSKKGDEPGDLTADLDGGLDNAIGSLELNGSSDYNTAGALSTVYFPFDSSTITETTKAILDANAAFLIENDAVAIQIEGHCDERGGIQYNLALGERRAKAVRDYLVALGVPRNRMSIISYGKEKPIEFGSNESAWARNRRGNFVITAK